MHAFLQCDLLPPAPPPASDSEFINVINIDLRGFQQMEWNM